MVTVARDRIWSVHHGFQNTGNGAQRKHPGYRTFELLCCLGDHLPVPVQESKPHAVGADAPIAKDRQTGLESANFRIARYLAGIVVNFGAALLFGCGVSTLCSPCREKDDLSTGTFLS